MLERQHVAAAAKVLALLGSIYAVYYLVKSQFRDAPTATAVTSSRSSLFARAPELKNPAPREDKENFGQLAGRFKDRAKQARHQTEQNAANQTQKLRGLLRNFVFSAEDTLSDAQHEAKKTVREFRRG